MHFQMFVSLGEFWNIGNWEIRKYFLEQEKNGIEREINGGISDGKWH